MEKRTEETIRERELGVFQTLSLHRKISRLFFFLKKNKPLETNFLRHHLCRKSSQKGKKETELRSHSYFNTLSPMLGTEMKTAVEKQESSLKLR